jgi:hypothetical protein
MLGIFFVTPYNFKASFISMSIDYEIYRKEILDLMGTLTIKFSPFANIMAQNYAEKTGKILTDDTNNPYYVNLVGQYHELNEMMYVTSLETGEKVPFDLNLRYDYPKTAALYKINTDEYKILCNTYPKQVDLIKSIVYPVTLPIEDIIAADDFTLLNGDFTMLHNNERESIKEALLSYLEYIKTRWFIRDFDYEEHYPIAFMGLVWAIMPQALLTRRIMNMKTVLVHPMHIWEYLGAKGLSDYRDILSDEQSMFLYRNIDYIRQNKGKKSNLIILAENLLKNLKVSLVSKTILQNTEDREDDCVTVPEFLSEEVVNYNTSEAIDEITASSMNDILYRVHEEGYYPEYSADDSAKMELKFGETEFNMLPTRLYEFLKYTVDTRYLELLMEFFIDTLLYRYSKGELQYRYYFKDPNVSVMVDLSIPDMILLLHYCIYRESGIVPSVIPKLYSSRIAYVNYKPKLGQDIPEKFNYQGFSYFYDSFIDTERILTEIPFTWGKVESSSLFMDYLAEQFLVLVDHVRDARRTANLRYQYALTHFYGYLRCHESFSIEKFTKAKNYEEWIANTLGVSELIEGYADLPQSNKFFSQLCDILLMQMFPVSSNSPLVDFMGAIQDDTLFYKKLKKLFITLCSRRLTYLDTDRNQTTFFMFPNQGTEGIHTDGTNTIMVSTESNEVNVITDTQSGVDLTGFKYNILYSNDTDVTSYAKMDYTSNMNSGVTEVTGVEPVDASTIKVTPLTNTQQYVGTKIQCGSRLHKTLS